jgi:hypothetical protein
MGDRFPQTPEYFAARVAQCDALASETLNSVSRNTLQKLATRWRRLAAEQAQQQARVETDVSSAQIAKPAEAAF